jgi:hypothetical protein
MGYRRRLQQIAANLSCQLVSDFASPQLFDYDTIVSSIHVRDALPGTAVCSSIFHCNRLCKR